MEVCARAEFFDVGEAEQEMRMANLCGARVEGVVKMYSSIFYTNKTGEERAALILKEYTRDLAVELDRYSVNKFSRIEIAIGVLTGLKNLHELNVCHYDIRPDNILVDRDGLKTEAVLTDLNLSSEIGAPVHPQGPDEYRPPEIRKLPNEEETLPVTPAMDIYSLGQTFKKLIKFPTILVGEALKLMMDEEPKNRPSSQDLLNLFTHEKRAQILCSAIKSSKKWKTIQTTSSSK